MKNIRKGDEVIVITGKDKGRRGTVLRVDGDRILVENVNVVKKHQKPNPAKNVSVVASSRRRCRCTSPT